MYVHVLADVAKEKEGFLRSKRHAVKVPVALRWNKGPKLRQSVYILLLSSIVDLSS